MRYGLPYQGSKSGIARQIVNVLPQGERFVDLFGGGFAMSHCALLSSKYRRVIYNDIDPLLPPLIEDAIDGKYSYDRFKPAWVSREEFHARKAEDGYVKLCWSFGGCGTCYLYGEDIEEGKKAAHDFVVNGDLDRWFMANLDEETLDWLDYRAYVGKEGIKERRLQYSAYMKRRGAHPQNVQHLQNIERLQGLVRLKARRGSLEMTCMDYREYEHREGDVVYCDPPYEGARGYRFLHGFDSEAFYEWAATRSYEVFFSSYEISDARFYPFKEMDKRSIFAQEGDDANSVTVTERLYSNRPRELVRARQINLFEEANE